MSNPTTKPISSDRAPAEAGAEALRALRHDLRTPINHIIGYGEMLLDEAADGDLASFEPDLQSICAAGRQLLALVNDYLNPARVEAYQQHVAARPRPYIDQIVERARALQALAETHGPPDVIPDLRKIEAAALRLIELFADGVNTALASKPPVATAPEPPEPPETTPARDRPSRLLVVDDNEMNRDMLSRRLERLGYAVVTAENGRRALELIAEQPLDLVLLDIMMPELDGYGVLERMRADGTLRRLPVIVLSALDEIDSVVRCLEMGAVDHLLKPFDPALLRARIDACLERKHLHDLERSYLSQIQKEKKRADDLLNVVIPIGLALAAEQDFNRLLERILLEARKLCDADGGTLYLRAGEQLTFGIVRNQTLGIALGGTTGSKPDFAPLRLYDEATGAPNHRYVVTHAALTGSTVNVPDAYQAEGFDFSGTQAFDQQTGYRSTSFLNVPLKDERGEVIGVLQLINAQDPETGRVVAFDQGLQQMIESLSTLAAVALGAYVREQGLRRQIEQLRVEIDETRKARQVAEITETDYFRSLQGKARAMRSGGQKAKNDEQHL
jgi:DNA-binding response OmpR family regulator